MHHSRHNEVIGRDGWVRKMQGVFDPSICGMSAERRMFSKLGFGDIVEKKNSFALLLVA